jgi:hypothetical protein
MAIVRAADGAMRVHAVDGRVSLSGLAIMGPTQARELSEALKAAAMIAEAHRAGVLATVPRAA